MAKKNEWILPALTIAATLTAIYYYRESQKKSSVIKRLEKEKILLLIDLLKKGKGFTEQLQESIFKLARQFETVDRRIANDLIEALQLLAINQPENAVEDLVKIMGVLLERHYSKDINCRTWLKTNKLKFDINGLLLYSKAQKKINEVEHSFFDAIKKIRNKEDHEIDFNLDKYLQVSGIIVGLGAIIKVSKIVYPTD